MNARFILARMGGKKEKKRKKEKNLTIAHCNNFSFPAMKGFPFICLYKHFILLSLVTVK